MPANKNKNARQSSKIRARETSGSTHIFVRDNVGRCWAWNLLRKFPLCQCTLCTRKHLHSRGTKPNVKSDSSIPSMGNTVRPRTHVAIGHSNVHVQGWFRQKAPPFRRAPSSLNVQSANKRPTPFPALTHKRVAMTCPTSKRSDRSSSNDALHSMPSIWRPCFGDDTASHVVCPRSTYKMASVSSKQPPTSVVAGHFLGRTHARSVSDGMRITHVSLGQCRHRSNPWSFLVGFHGSLLSPSHAQKQKGNRDARVCTTPGVRRDS